MKFKFYFYEGVYSLDECKDLCDKIETGIDKNIPDQPAGELKNADVGVFLLGHLRNDLGRFHQLVFNANRNVFGFNLFELNDYDPIHYNVYDGDKKAEYGWHDDASPNEPGDIKLTAILNVSEEEYEGGDLELFINGPMIIEPFKKPGTMIVFPSFIQHRVTPVTKGKRITISQWLSGPKWQ